MTSIPREREMLLCWKVIYSSSCARDLEYEDTSIFSVYMYTVQCFVVVVVVLPAFNRVHYI